MKNNSSFLWMIFPLGVFVFLALVLFVERSGVSYEVQDTTLQFLEPREASFDAETTGKSAECLVLYDSGGIDGLGHYETVIDTLNSMRVKYDLFDVASSDQFDLNNYQTAIVSFIDLDKIEKQIIYLTNWVEDGGQVLFSIRPDPSPSYTAIYRKMGIRSIADSFVVARGAEFVTDLLPGTKGTKLGEDFMVHEIVPVQLEKDAHVHLLSADEYSLPLLWEYDYGTGHFVVINTDVFTDKNSRGIIGSAYSLLKNVCIYPVINSSMYFIDDFPGPIPNGEYDVITQQFGRDIEGYYVNIWWPDMQSFARKYGLKYTGMMIETYNDQVKPPFDPEGEIDKYQYFGGLLLENGGEIGLHGYNHLPFCFEDIYEGTDLSYPGWSSTDAMQASVDELYRFGNLLFPEQSFTTYVPPSNVLCKDAREWLPRQLPDLRVIASEYLSGENTPGYEQEFTEASDGIVELPRIVSGFELTEYMQWVAVNEIALHYVNSYFVHPDDVLDKERGAEKGWLYLRDRFDEYLMWLHISAPGMRNMTASEGAMAVQRFDRLEVDAEFDGMIYSISLDNFYDQAWLMMRSSLEPETIDGGNITEVASDLYLIETVEADIQIQFKE